MRPVSCSALPPPGSVAVMLWLRAVTAPVTTVGAPPSALPTAATEAPIEIFAESPIGTVVSPAAPRNWSTATSLVASAPTTAAGYARPVLATVTVMLAASWMT